MKKRARLCFYIFLVLSFLALGILGFYVFDCQNKSVMLKSKKLAIFNTQNLVCSSINNVFCCLKINI